MKGLVTAAERAMWAVASPLNGSSHEHYRQALWRPTRQEPASVALSDTFAGIQGASGWNRRSWRYMGVVQARGDNLRELLAQPNVDPALAFTMGKMLVVGRIAAPDAFGHMITVSGQEGDIAHGLRLGPDKTQFGIGVLASNGEFITPPAEDLITMGPVDIDTAIRQGNGFGAINFS